MISVGSLFSGIGGLELGLEMAGDFEVKWQAEKDPFCLKVLEKHWPNVKRYTDVREIDESTEHVDLICGGFPCQPVSCAGKRKGDKDSRWMWPEFRRIIQCLRPKWVLAENVPGLLSADSGRLFGGILKDLAESGYNAEWQVLSAAQFGAPHLRRRVFVIAHPASIGCENGFEESGFLGSPINTWEGAVPSRKNNENGVLANSADWNGYDVRWIWPQSDAERDRIRIRPWKPEPSVGRMADGVPRRVDRLRSLGNAVVPQVSQYIGQCILEAMI